MPAKVPPGRFGPQVPNRYLEHTVQVTRDTHPISPPADITIHSEGEWRRSVAAEYF